MKTIDNKDIIEYLLYAERDAHEVSKITNEYPEITIEEAYVLQDGLLQRRLKENNTKTIGMKLGLTSTAKQEMMGVKQPIYGYLHKDMLAYEWEPLSCSELIHPKIEPEIAFFISEDIQGENITEEDISQATKYVAPALEIIDSRYKDFRFTLVDVVADNCSSAKFVVGSNLQSPHSIDVGNIGMVMSKNGKVEQTGSSAAVLGHPLKAMAWAANLLGKRDKGFKKGDIVLSGAISEAISLEAGDKVVVDFDNLGTVSISCTD
ncbi:2-keto-4-pentenoate hydratase [Oceanobacillus sp. Castelsardo]|uniref:2-keto-4-pentenoate hydratase n=1 Tax=Oceanobacillus sp. Castelsardo TaxID=1851204 RepID=UPI000838461F|nr:fumarylacetoacetate hydrolase family protein [Oceanobacillus sp. Castelsardo]